MDEDVSLREMEFTLRFPDVTLVLLGSKSLVDSKGASWRGQVWITFLQLETSKLGPSPWQLLYLDLFLVTTQVSGHRSRAQVVPSMGKMMWKGVGKTCADRTPFQDVRPHFLAKYVPHSSQCFWAWCFSLENKHSSLNLQGVAMVKCGHLSTEDCNQSSGVNHNGKQYLTDCTYVYVCA